jgi:hypothetical protein
VLSSGLFHVFLPSDWPTPSAFLSVSLPFPNFSSALKMETVCYSETLTSTNETTRRQTAKHHDR